MSLYLLLQDIHIKNVLLIQINIISVMDAKKENKALEDWIEEQLEWLAEVHLGR
jgi:hypothetical protein